MFYWIKNNIYLFLLTNKSRLSNPFSNRMKCSFEQKCKSEWTAKVNELQQWNAIHANANWPPKLQLLHWSAICAQIASKQIHLSPTLIFPSLHLEIQANHWMFIKLNPPISRKHLTLWYTVWTRLKNCTSIEFFFSN